MFYAIALMSDLKPGDRSASRIKFGRSALVFLVAVALTAIWAGIFYGLSRLFGWQFTPVVAIPVLSAIFVIAMLVMGLAVSASDEPGTPERAENGES